jgi:hypothetical protein
MRNVMKDLVATFLAALFFVFCLILLSTEPQAGQTTFHLNSSEMAPRASDPLRNKNVGPQSLDVPRVPSAQRKNDLHAPFGGARD